MTVFNSYARYYDLLYRDKDYVAEAAYIERLIRRYMPYATRIVELGSGTGKHASLLTDKGFTVHGIERSQEMLERASHLATRNPALTFSLGDMRSARLHSTFHAAISLFHVMSYQTTNEALVSSFETARLHVEDGGLFIFDVWYGPAVLTDRPTVRIKRMSDETIEVTRIAEPLIDAENCIVKVNYHIFVRNKVTAGVSEHKETHPMRYFFSPEIKLLARDAGWQFVYSEEWLSGRPLGFDTWSACFVFKAA